MPTTREALNHARAANVPIVVAVTKIDKRNANPDTVRQELAELGLTADEWGGDTLVVPVSAQQGKGIDDLLEAILLTAEEQEIIANPAADPSGIVLEAEINANRGTLATLLVLNGTLRRGDVVLAGESHGRIKAMYDELGKNLEEAGPSVPVRVLGLGEPPQPGDTFEKVKNDKLARQVASERKDVVAARRAQADRPTFTLEDVFAQFSSGRTKELNLIVKADLQGTLQPVVDQLKALAENNEHGIGMRILSADIGNISENDVMLASASNAIIIGFTVEADNAARRSADAKGVEIRLYEVIYKLLEDIDLALKGMLEPVYADKNIGSAEVRQIFKIPRVGVIAGSYVRDGEIKRGARARVKRGNKVIAENLTISSLKRMQEDVREVRSGFECGIGLNNFNEFQVGDVVEFYVSERVS